jgi:hypothetical protein
LAQVALELLATVEAQARLEMQEQIQLHLI